MGRRLELQTTFETLLGSRNVYYQPPENLKLNYPAIIYSKDDMDIIYADNTNYRGLTRYKAIVVDRLPDNEVIEKILKIPLTSFDRHYIFDNLNHDVIIIYF